uniref:Uncharacterized protein n=1 Tax=Rhizophora mucronata TaxID=61149 RepID=A0A2P2NWY0_RHIMU
MSGKRPWN